MDDMKTYVCLILPLGSRLQGRRQFLVAEPQTHTPAISSEGSPWGNPDEVARLVVIGHVAKLWIFGWNNSYPDWSECRLRWWSLLRSGQHKHQTRNQRVCIWVKRSAWGHYRWLGLWEKNSQDLISQTKVLSNLAVDLPDAIYDQITSLAFGMFVLKRKTIMTLSECAYAICIKKGRGNWPVQYNLPLRTHMYIVSNHWEIQQEKGRETVLPDTSSYMTTWLVGGDVVVSFALMEWAKSNTKQRISWCDNVVSNSVSPNSYRLLSKTVRLCSAMPVVQVPNFDQCNVKILLDVSKFIFFQGILQHWVYHHTQRRCAGVNAYIPRLRGEGSTQRTAVWRRRLIQNETWWLSGIEKGE